MWCKREGLLKIRLHYKHSAVPKNLKVVVVINDSLDQRLAQLSTDHFSPLVLDGAPSAGAIECLVPCLNLVRGRYYLHLGATDQFGQVDWIDRACAIDVIDGAVFGTASVPNPAWGTFVVPSEWRCVNGM